MNAKYQIEVDVTAAQIELERAIRASIEARASAGDDWVAWLKLRNAEHRAYLALRAAIAAQIKGGLG